MKPLMTLTLIVSALCMSTVFAIEETGERVIASDTRTDIIVLPSIDQLDQLSDADLARLVQAIGGETGAELAKGPLNDSSRAATRLRGQRTRFLRAELIRIEERTLNNPFNINDPVNNSFVNGQVVQKAPDDLDNNNNNNNAGGGGAGGLNNCIGQTLQGAASGTAPADFRFLNIDIDPNTLNCQFFSGNSADGLFLILQYQPANPPAVLQSQLSIFADATVPTWTLVGGSIFLQPFNGAQTFNLSLSSNTGVDISVTIQVIPNGAEFSATITSLTRTN